MKREILAWRALAAAALAGTAWRIASAPYAPTFDDAWYLETSFRLWEALKEGPLAFVSAYTSAFRIKAPLVALLPLPLYALFGSGERVALWANVGCLAWTAWSVQRIGARAFSAAAGEAAAALTLCLPLLFGLSRLFFVEPLLTALVCATIAEALEERPRPGRLGALLGLGLLAKSIFPLYVAGPLWLRRRELRPAAAQAALVALAVASTWYAFNLPYVLAFAFSAGFGSIARHYSPGPTLSATTLGVWLALLVKDGLSWPLASVSLLVLAASARFGRGPMPAGSRALAAAWLLPLTVFALGVNKEIRFAAPLLPAFAVAVGAAWARLPGRGRPAALAALAGAALWVFSAQTFGVPAAEPLRYNEPAQAAAAWDRAALVSALDASARPTSVVAIGIEHPALNANNVASKAAERGLPWRTTSLGYAQPSAEGALIRLKDKGADHLVLVEGVARAELPDLLNRANAGIAAAITSSRLEATETAIVPLAPGVRARVFLLR